MRILKILFIKSFGWWTCICLVNPAAAGIPAADLGDLVGSYTVAETSIQKETDIPVFLRSVKNKCRYIGRTSFKDDNQALVKIFRKVCGEIESKIDITVDVTLPISQGEKIWIPDDSPVQSIMKEIERMEKNKL